MTVDVPVVPVYPYNIFILSVRSGKPEQTDYMPVKRDANLEGGGGGKRG